MKDHARALYKVVTEGVVGETYNIGGHNEKQNLDVVKTICSLLEEMAPNKPAGVVHYEGRWCNKMSSIPAAPDFLTV